MAEVKPTHLTKEGLKHYQEKLEYLKGEKTIEIIKRIEIARGFGDLSENSEYDEAKQEQGRIHARIAELREIIANAKVIDESQIDESKVSVGSIVEIVNKTRNMEVTYHIVGSYETDPFSGKISDQSPIGAALVGKRAGDTVEAELPNGSVAHFEIRNVRR